MTLWQSDKCRKGQLPLYQFWFRKASAPAPALLKLFYKAMYRFTAFLYKCEISSQATIGPGLAIVHPFCITVHPRAVIGRNCNLHKGVTIGMENRGRRVGAPTIGDAVWIGVNATVVGNINIGDDVLIAPNSYVNTDVPPHSVVFGNPCVIRPRNDATERYRPSVALNLGSGSLSEAEAG